MITARNRFDVRPHRARRDETAGLVLGGATTAMGLIAGTFCAYACSVMIGLARTDDRTFVHAMQQINEAIQNPVFFAGFFGAFVLTAISAVQQRRFGARDVTRWVLAALVGYVAGALLLHGRGERNRRLG